MADVQDKDSKKVPAVTGKKRYELKWATTGPKGEIIPAGTKVELTDKEVADYPDDILVQITAKVEQKASPPVNQKEDGSFDDSDPKELGY